MRGLSIHHSVLIMHGASLVMSLIGYLCLNLNMLFSNFIFLFTLFLAISVIIILDKDFPLNQFKRIYLDFELPIKEIDEKISKLVLNQNNTEQVNNLKILLNNKIKEIYSNLSRWQRVQLARHPNRPYSLDYINYFCNNFFELHGDRSYV